MWVKNRNYCENEKKKSGVWFGGGGWGPIGIGGGLVDVGVEVGDGMGWGGDGGRGFGG